MVISRYEFAFKIFSLGNSCEKGYESGSVIQNIRLSNLNLQKLIVLWFLGFLIPNLATAQQLSTKLEVVTSHFKPYSYMKNDEPEGISVQQVYKIFDQLGDRPPVHVGKWKNVYQRALTRPNVLIFSLLRTPEREEKFHWIGKIGEVEAFLFRAKGNQRVEVNSLSDGLKYVTGAIEKDAKGKYLISKGYHPFSINNQHSGIKMLLRGRLDLIVGDIKSLQHDLYELGLREDSIEPVLKLEDVSKPIYVALSRDTKPDVVEELKAAYRQAFD